MAYISPVLDSVREASTAAAVSAARRDSTIAAALLDGERQADAADAAGISVQVASPRRLLAMKVAVARVGRDVEDIVLLAREVGARSIDEVLDIAYAEYGELLEVRSRFVVLEALAGILPEHRPEAAIRPSTPPSNGWGP